MGLSRRAWGEHKGDGPRMLWAASPPSPALPTSPVPEGKWQNEPSPRLQIEPEAPHVPTRHPPPQLPPSPPTLPSRHPSPSSLTSQPSRAQLVLHPCVSSPGHSGVLKPLRYSGPSAHCSAQPQSQMLTPRPLGKLPPAPTHHPPPRRSLHGACPPEDPRLVGALSK